ncbi:MAG: pyridoxamine 5'-phosphate oxidase family protein [Acidobacteriota bacterium]
MNKDEQVRAFLKERHAATLGTQNPDGSLHLTAVWYLFQEEEVFIATHSATRKAQNVAAQGQAGLTVDCRRAGIERGASSCGVAEVLTGAQSKDLNEMILGRYLSEEAMSDPRVGPAMIAMNDVTIRLIPGSWSWWHVKVLDQKICSGALTGTPGYILPLD